jgi:hypothetical protein
MCFYCKAASMVLDTLWAEPDMRQHFYAQGVELSDLGPLTHEVFVSAYRAVKDQLDAEAMALFEAQVTEDLLAPFYDRPGFRQVWDEWNQEMREEFIREQSELNLALLLIRFYQEEFAESYKHAFAVYREKNAATSA